MESNINPKSKLDPIQIQTNFDSNYPIKLLDLLKQIIESYSIEKLSNILKDQLQTTLFPPLTQNTIVCFTYQGDRTTKITRITKVRGKTLSCQSPDTKTGVVLLHRYQISPYLPELLQVNSEQEFNQYFTDPLWKRPSVQMPYTMTTPDSFDLLREGRIKEIFPLINCYENCVLRHYMTLALNGKRADYSSRFNVGDTVTNLEKLIQDKVHDCGIIVRMPYVSDPCTTQWRIRIRSNYNQLQYDCKPEFLQKIVPTPSSFVTTESELESSPPPTKKQRCRQNKKNDSLECIVCRDNPRNVLFTPCRHFAICSKCNDLLEKDQCPVCQKTTPKHLRQIVFVT